MKYKLIIIVGPTCTNKSNIAISYVNKFNGILVPIDQLHLYKFLQYGTNLNLTKLYSVRNYGYQILSPWTVFKPQLYIEWLIQNIKVLLQCSNVVIEGGCTSYIKELVGYLNQNNIGHKYEIYCLDRCSQSIQRAKRRCTLGRIKNIINETKAAIGMGFIRVTSEKMFSDCEKLFKHPEYKNDDLAWAFRISAKTYFPAFLNIKGTLDLDETQNRIIANLLEIQNYQHERLVSIFGRNHLLSYDEVYNHLLT